MNRRDKGPRKRKDGHGAGRRETVILYGRHAVTAALANPRRRFKRLLATAEGLEALRAQTALPEGLEIERMDSRSLAAAAPADAPTQGLLLETAPLPPLTMEEAGLAAPGPAVALLLDQVEDPRNVGAILRSAAAFGARAVITQDRHSPPESGALAKAASGALDCMAWLRATNLSAALDSLAGLGYWRVGLAGDAKVALGEIDLGDRLALVLGSEGRGLRPRVQAHCDLLARIPLRPASPVIESLNVSAAAAVALYALMEPPLRRH